MEEDMKMKFVCKYCNKRYPCGKSLGGHLRAHRNLISIEAEEEGEANIVKFAPFNGGKKSKRDLEYELVGQSGYGLRENPRKSLRFMDADSNLQQEIVCKECGKGFHSLKALCGHMACHSETEAMNLRQQKRSEKIEYKNLDVYSVENDSSSVSSEIEQEELAMCLIMLSRDSCQKTRFESVTEFSDNNSVVLEAISSSIDMKITVKKGRKSNYVEHGVSDNSYSGYFWNGSKKVQSDVCIDGFHKNGKIKKSKVEDESGFEGYDAILGIRGAKTEEGYARGDRVSIKYGVRKEVKNDPYSPELQEKKTENGSSNFEYCRKYENLKTFPSNYSESICESGENSIETYSCSVPMPKSNKVIKPLKGKEPIHHDLAGNAKNRLGPKKRKGHVCPICFRVFRSGQALGGHKRSHFVGGSEDKTVVINQEVTERHCLFDLNLPAPTEEDSN